MDEKHIAALLVNAAATVYAAQLETSKHHGIKSNLATCGADVFIAWREMTKSVREVLQAEKKQQ
jgi:hypothetical protein